MATHAYRRWMQARAAQLLRTRPPSRASLDSLIHGAATLNPQLRLSDEREVNRRMIAALEEDGEAEAR